MMHEYKIDEDHIFYTEEPLTEDEFSMLKRHKLLILALFKSKPSVIRVDLKKENE